jgi:type IV secretory pathway VirB10-like protein
MFSRPLAFVLLGLGCVTAAAGGAYVATRQNAAQPAPTAIVDTAVPAGGAATGTPATAAAQPVAETEAPVTGAKLAERSVEAEKPLRATPPPAKPRKSAGPKRPAPVTRSARTEIPAERTVPFGNGAPASQAPAAATPAAPAPVAPAPEQPRPIEAQPVAPPVPQFEEVIVPASSVIGLQLESTLSSERARLEDRVEARVTRDVLAAGRVAIPAGSRVLGSVTLVERGGKVKERARLGVRFHTVILADGNEVPLQTEAIYRDGESPAGDSAKKIGVAAVGGAILGGILGGKKGAAIGGATGAAGGTAAVMSGDRQAALLRGGEIVTARLSSPATITVERRE